MGRMKGTPKTGGRTAGTPNKIGKDLRPLLEQEVEKLIPEIGDIWEELSAVEKARFLPALLRIAVPTQINFDTPNEKSAIQLTIERLNSIKK